MNTQLKDVLADAAKDSLRPQVDEAFNKFKQKRVFVVRGLLAAAAAVLLLLAAPVFLTTSYQRPEDLFAQHFELPEEPSVERGGVSDGQWVQALDAYDQAHYTKSAGLIEQVLKNPAFEDKATAYYLLGMCHAAEDRYDQAIAALEMVGTSNLFYPDTQWYLALFCLKTQNFDQAKGYLREIAGNEAHFKQQQAADILKKLK